MRWRLAELKSAFHFSFSDSSLQSIASNSMWLLYVNSAGAGKIVCLFLCILCDIIKWLKVQYFHSSPISLNSWRISVCVCALLSGASLLLLTLNLLTLSRCWGNLCIWWSEIRLLCILVPFGWYCAFKSYVVSGRLEASVIGNLCVGGNRK